MGKKAQGKPLVSVVMASYNAEKYIRVAIESILRQSFKDFELIVIDDASTDKTWDIARSYQKKDKRIVLLRNAKNLKSCRTMLKGMKMCRGRYIAVMDNDDYSYPNRLQKQVDFLQKNKKVGIVGGTIKIVNNKGSFIGNRKYYLTDEEIRRHIFLFSPFAHPTVMFRKSALDRVGYYNPKYAPADDYELYFRIGTVSEFGNLPDVLLKYRVLSDSITNASTKIMQLNTIKIRRMYNGRLGYHMTFTDKLVTAFHYLAAYLLPHKAKLWLFNTFRNTK